ncbi:MAG: hypothetical protein H0V17_29015, partial [Deltaproteobacteria bacterium]|nr:hypothetical protein [Deltaproteobacteria bacterium]
MPVSATTVGAAVICALLTRPAHADLCAARVELEGDIAVIGQVTAELARLGVERGSPAPGCRGVFAQVESDRDGGIAVAIRDGAKRSEGRVVSDAAVAASWIDSWLHDELDGRAWLLAAPVRVAEASSLPASILVAAAPRDVAPRRISRLSVTVGYEHAWTEDGASAGGIGGTACLGLGKACFGVRGHYLREADRTVGVTAMARGDASVMAIARLPLQAGRMSIAPELGLGFGRMSTRRIDGCEPIANQPTDPNCDPMDPTCMPEPASCMDPNGKVHVGDNFATATFTPRLAASVRIAVPLFDRVWLDGVAGITLAPF